MQRAEAGLALKKGVPETTDFFFFFLLLGASVGGPVCAFPPAAETKPPCPGLRLSWELWSFLKTLTIV